MVKVLLADDSITIQKVVQLVLPDYEYQVKAVKNGSEAIALMGSFKPDIVLSDTEMPVMDGYRLCEEIKKNPATRNVPVILLYGAFEPIDERLARKVGADGSLPKPFEADEIIGKITEALGAQVPEAAAVEEFEAVEAAEEAPEEEVMVAATEEGEAFALDELWNIEGLTGEPAVAEELVEEASLTGEAIEEAVSEEAIEEALAEEAIEEGVSVSPAAALPAARELLESFKETADERIGEFLKGADLRGMLFEALAPKLKESIDSVLWELAPEIIEKLTREALKDTMASLTKELEHVIWETVPELAETIIREEIAKIRAGGP
jgi:CheY-like chemotaxis protein